MLLSCRTDRFASDPDSKKGPSKAPLIRALNLRLKAQLLSLGGGGGGILAMALWSALLAMMSV